MLMKNLSKEDRAAVVKVVSDDGVTPLFLAAQLGRLLFVNFLLDECFASIEQRGMYEVIEDRSRHQVTPLW
jgi:ankyrin repeat protein